MHQVLPTSFDAALALGQQNEAVIEHELRYHGINVQPTDHFTKQPFDFFLPDGSSVEVKLDIRSQGTRCIALEEPSYQRAADFHIHTICYAKVFTRAQVEALWRKGKITQAGDYGYNVRYVPMSEVRNTGVYLHEFIKSLKV